MYLYLEASKRPKNDDQSIQIENRLKTGEGIAVEGIQSKRAKREDSLKAKRAKREDSLEAKRPKCVESLESKRAKREGH